MTQILIGGDQSRRRQLEQWLDAWGLPSSSLGEVHHPAAVPVSEARAVIYACGPAAPALPGDPLPAFPAAPLVLLGEAGPSSLDDRAWTRVADPGPDGSRLAAALRPCLERPADEEPGHAFRDFLNHELRTPLTAAGTALQTLALQLEGAGGPSLDLVDLALRNLRRLEQTIDWTNDYLVGEPGDDRDGERQQSCLTELLEDLDELDAPVPLTWATGAGDWEALVGIGRARWRRMLRQVLRAVGCQAPGQLVHLELSTLDEEHEQAGLLLVFHLDPGALAEPVQRTGARDEAEQLRRLLSFSVNPELARGLGMRFDVVRLADRLRLRVLLPVAMSRSPQPA